MARRRRYDFADPTLGSIRLEDRQALPTIARQAQRAGRQNDRYKEAVNIPWANNRPTARTS